MLQRTQPKVEEAKGKPHSVSSQTSTIQNVQEKPIARGPSTSGEQSPNTKWSNDGNTTNTPDYRDATKTPNDKDTTNIPNERDTTTHE